MGFHGNVRPGKAASVLGVLAGLLFGLLGVVMVIPIFGLFGVIWTLFALGMAAFYAYNLMSASGSSLLEVDVSPTSPDSASLDPEARLRRLDRMRDEGLITADEYTAKRAAILAEPW